MRAADAAVNQSCDTAYKLEDSKEETGVINSATRVEGFTEHQCDSSLGLCCHIISPKVLIAG